MQTIWYRLVKSCLSVDRGMLWQLRNMLNRTAVSTDPSTNVKAAEDFLMVVLHGYIVAAGEALQSVSTMDNVRHLAKGIVNSFVRLELYEGTSRTPASIRRWHTNLC